MKHAPLNRKRKTKDPCPECGLHKNLCICELIPSLTFATKVCLIIHKKELKRTTNTGRLAIKSLTNSEIRIRGGEDRQVLDLSDLLVPTYRTFLFYPSDDAVELDRDLVEQSPLPIQLIVPDGNWRQASKVYTRHTELKDVPKVKISTTNSSIQHLRAEHSAEGMATLQAIAQALQVIEGPQAVEPLMKLYEAKLRNTLIGRGQIQASAGSIPSEKAR
ncbi:tRNA-uridine aminocarboxypropyltransferase [Bdellovibrio sp.]|uniref:tRNA-uridine aminocarboxypropyltransferase n=1 Tax=Bdellovibrio sp. TaxID=28201 RepID=UPI003221F87D